MKYAQYLQDDETNKCEVRYPLFVIGLIIALFFTSIPVTISRPSKAMTEELEEYYIQTQHPYPNLHNQEWTYKRSGATQIYVHFQKIEMELCCDYIYIKNSAGTIIQTIQGNYPNGLYSNWISGDTVKIHFTSDYSVVYYGFLINHFGYYNASLTVESPHLTNNYYDHTWTITQYDYTSRIRVRFETINTETGYDKVYIRDANNNLKATYSGVYTNIWTDFIIGNTIKIQFVTDSSVQSWGFKVDCVDGYEADDDANPTELATLAIGDYVHEQDISVADANITKDRFISRDWDRNYHTQNENGKESSFDDADGMSDVIYYTGHGQVNFLALYHHETPCWSDPYCEWDPYEADSQDFGGEDAEWLFIIACDVLGGDQDDEAVQKSFLKDGLHAVYGYDVSFSPAQALNFSLSFTINLLDNGWAIEYSFARASHDAPTSIWGCVSLSHDISWQEHMWGHGVVYPDQTGTGDVTKRHQD